MQIVERELVEILSVFGLKEIECEIIIIKKSITIITSNRIITIRARKKVIGLKYEVEYYTSKRKLDQVMIATNMFINDTLKPWAKKLVKWNKKCTIGVGKRKARNLLKSVDNDFLISTIPNIKFIKFFSLLWSNPYTQF